MGKYPKSIFPTGVRATKLHSGYFSFHFAFLLKYLETTQKIKSELRQFIRLRSEPVVVG